MRRLGMRFHNLPEHRCVHPLVVRALQCRIYPRETPRVRFCTLDLGALILQQDKEMRKESPTKPT